MPLLYAIPLIVGGYALFTGAIANKPDPSPAPVTGSSNMLGTLALYGAAGAGVYFLARKVIK